MTKRNVITIEGDEQGRVFMPSDLSKQYGLKAGSKVRLDEDSIGFRFSRSSDNLALVYVEPTNMCNLDCSICMRKVMLVASGFGQRWRKKGKCFSFVSKPSAPDFYI